MAHRAAGSRGRAARRQPRRPGGAASEARVDATPVVGRSPAVEAPASEDAEPQALVVTHWFDPAPDGEPYPATVRFSGRRAGVHGKPGHGDSFVHDEPIDRVIPGSGPVSISAWVYGLEPGEWSVTAELLPGASGASAAGGSPKRPRQAVPPAGWSWRLWALAARPTSLVRTRWALTAPLARIPAVVPGSLPLLVLVGAALALASQAAILAHEEVSVGRSLLVSLVAIVSGLAAAKLWYAVLHPDEPIWRPGWAVDGFLIVAPLAALGALLALNLPIGVYLDASTPGLFAAVALGRVGCFLTGCCAGRCTRSRWGVWSSDRRVGARRVPAQLLESVTGLALAAVTLPLVILHPPIHGIVFVGAFAIYALARQGLLRLRAERRRSSRSLPLTAAASAAILLALTAALVAYPRHPPSMAGAAHSTIDESVSQ